MMSYKTENDYSNIECGVCRQQLTVFEEANIRVECNKRMIWM